MGFQSPWRAVDRGVDTGVSFRNNCNTCETTYWFGTYIKITNKLEEFMSLCFPETLILVIVRFLSLHDHQYRYRIPTIPMAPMDTHHLTPHPNRLSQMKRFSLKPALTGLNTPLGFYPLALREWRTSCVVCWWPQTVGTPRASPASPLPLPWRGTDGFFCVALPIRDVDCLGAVPTETV